MIPVRFLAAVATGSLVVATIAYAAPPHAPPPAQIRAEATCSDQHVGPNSSTWELCLSHVTRAYEWDEPALAQQLAQAAGNAQESCRDEGFDAQTAGYRACVDREIDASSQLMILGDDTTGENVAELR